MKNPNLSRSGPKTVTRLLELMKDGKPRTAFEAAADLGMSVPPIYVATKQLHQDREVRISGWKLNATNNCQMAIWSIGSEPDEPKPDCSGRKFDPPRPPAQPAFRDWMDIALFGEAVA